MHRMMLLLALLLSAHYCSAQLLVPQDPRATAVLFYAGQLPRVAIAPMTDQERAKLQQVYTAVLAGDAALDAEGDALAAQKSAFENTLLAAIVKAHPKMEPMLRSLSNSLPDKEQRREIGRAQSEILQADPFLQADWDKLAARLADHRKKVDAAMVKLDPSVAPIQAKFLP